MREQHMHQQLTTEKAMADYHDGINSRGDQAVALLMRKPLTASYLRSDGGVIAIEANNHMDTEWQFCPRRQPSISVPVPPLLFD